MSVEWRGDKYKENLEKELIKRLYRAAIVFKREVQKELSVAVQIMKLPKGRNSAGRFVSGKQFKIRSKPGEPARKDFGELRRSIAFAVDEKKLVARVGSNKIYNKYLELGTSLMRARPVWRPMLVKLRKQIKGILEGK